MKAESEGGRAAEVRGRTRPGMIREERMHGDQAMESKWTRGRSRREGEKYEGDLKWTV